MTSELDLQVKVEGAAEGAAAGAAEVQAGGCCRGWFHWRKYFHYAGPGFIMAIAYLDPGNLEADLQLGAGTGYSLLWMLALSTMLGWVMQDLAIRLGVVTGKHLAQHCRDKLTRFKRNVVWLLSEMTIIAVDIQEVVGAAIAFRILFGLPLWVGCLITAADTITFLVIHVLGARVFEAFFTGILCTMTVCFALTFFMAPPTAMDIVGGFEPILTKYSLFPAVGVIGSVIMPHNMYLQSGVVLAKDRRFKKEACKYLSLDTAFALVLSFLINMFVVGSCARNFYAPVCATAATPSACLPVSAIDTGSPTFGTCNVAGALGTCQPVGLSGVQYALMGTLGKSATIIWAVGLLAAGQSGTMTSTYAGQFVMEGFAGLNMAPWKITFVTRLCALLPALLLTILASKSKTASDTMAQWLNVLQSLTLPFVLIPLVGFVSSASVMGKYSIGFWHCGFVCTCVFAIVVINLFLLGSNAIGQNAILPQVWWMFALAAVLGAAYILFALALAYESFKPGKDSSEVDEQEGKDEDVGVGVCVGVCGDGCVCGCVGVDDKGVSASDSDSGSVFSVEVTLAKNKHLSASCEQFN